VYLLLALMFCIETAIYCGGNVSTTNSTQNVTRNHSTTTTTHNGNTTISKTKTETETERKTTTTITTKK
jgi:hypothetical protein